MAVQYQDQAQLQISGLNTAGHPLTRPRGSTYECDNFRVMPGGWLRLRSGRRMRREQTAGKFIQFHPFRWLEFPEVDSQFVQHALSDSEVHWQWLSMNDYSLVDIKKIETIYDGGYGLNNAVAAVTVRDRVFFYNGLGVRDNTASQSPLSTWVVGAGMVHQQIGLDIWAPNGLPTATFQELPTGSISINEHRQVWVGLQNGLSGHYSNAVLAGQLGPQGGLGQIVVSGLTKLLMPRPGGSTVSENGAINYVFYITVDGGEIPYLIMDQSMVNPYIVPVSFGQDTAVLNFPWTSVDPMLGGVYADPTKEMPTTNFPPRPMRSMAYVNGRVYGVLLPKAGKGEGAMPIQPDAKTGAKPIKFTYETKVSKELTGVYWSNAARDSFDKEFVGVPEESWPQDFFAYAPSGEPPLVLDDAKTRVLVICGSSCFLLEETADGIHEWTEISRIRGISAIKTLTKTTYGHIWVTQMREVVLLPPDSAQLLILSKDYQSAIDADPICASYVLDPKNQVDRYQVWLKSGKAICHDFALQTAYSESPHHYECAKTLVRRDGVRHHFVANQSIYTIEGQPENGLVPTMDDMPAGAPKKVIEGSILRNWDDFGDATVRKDFSWVDTIAQNETVQMNWRSNFNQQSVDVSAIKTPQSLDDFHFRFKMKNPTAFWYQFGFDLDGTLDNVPAYYPDPGMEGNSSSNFYGAILRLMYQAGNSGNRT